MRDTLASVDGDAGRGAHTVRYGTPSSETDAETTGRRIGRYVVLHHLGAGGMGTVFAAYDPELDRKVAIKLLRGSGEGSEGQARLVREAQAMARLSHPHVVAVHAKGLVHRDFKPEKSSPPHGHLRGR